MICELRGVHLQTKDFPKYLFGFLPEALAEGLGKLVGLPDEALRCTPRIQIGEQDAPLVTLGG